MADLKISQLTGATTPLAGTEVLPVVQSSSTKKVSVANLTAGRAVSVGSLASAGSVQIGTSGPYAVGTVYADANWGMLFTTATSAPANSDYGWLNYAGATLAKINSNNFVLESGNFVPNTAAKGVNFTANTPAAGMTSQLLNWYEEGTWTPALTFGGAAVGLTGTFTGTYTRIGNTVSVWGKIVLTNKGSSTGNALITGLPFAAGADPAASSNVIDPITGMANLTANGCMFSVISGSAVYPMVQTATARTQITEQYFTNSSQIVFSSTYKV